MKTIKLASESLIVALATWCAVASPAQAAPTTWGAAQNITGASDVLNTGSTVYAYAIATDVGAQSVNGVSFAVAGGGGAGNLTISGGQAAGPYFPLSSPAGYNGILKGAVFANSGSGATITVTLNNLVNGQEYNLQVWSSNVDYGGSLVTYDGSVSLNQTIGQFAIGTFTADATSQVIQITANNCQLNAIQLRTVPAPGTPPSVAISSPANNATVGANFTVNATASDTGSIASVAFYDGATLLGTDTTAPYSYAWTGASIGAHVLTAVATDDENNSTTSAVVNVTVTNITWGAAQNVTGASDVLNTGSTVYAYAIATDAGAQTVNGVSFAVGNINGGGADVTITGGQAAGPYFPLSSPAGYNGILKGAVFANSASGAAMMVTLNNLTIGQEYNVQVWSSNVDYTGSLVTYDGSVSLNQTIGQFAIGTFTANATTQAIQITANNCQLNAIQLRTVPAPAFGSWVAARGLAGSEAAFDADPDRDGIPNGIEFVIGGEPNPSNAGSNSNALLPTAGIDGSNFVFTFMRMADSAYLNPSVEFASDTGGVWTTAADPANATIQVFSGSPADTVIVTIPRGQMTKCSPV